MKTKPVAALVALRAITDMSRTTLTVNGRTQTVDVEPNTPLLWVVRDTHLRTDRRPRIRLPDDPFPSSRDK